MYGQTPYPNGQSMPQGYPNPYLNWGNQQSRAPRYEIIKVNGKNGADAFDMGPNSTALLLDTTAPIVWYKETDGAGYPKLVPYQISQIPEKEPEQPLSAESLQSTLAAFENSLAARMEAIINGKSNPDATKPKQTRSNSKDSTES